MSDPHPISEEQEALLRSIVAQPGDDAARLVYADWLDEHDDAEQAAFIRESIEAHNLPPGDPRREALAAELQEVSTARGKVWLAAAGVSSADELDPQFHRGCVEGVECQSMRPLYEAGERLFTLFPIRELYFWWQYSHGLSPDALEWLSEVTGLERFRRLHLANYDDAVAGDRSAAVWGKFFLCPRLSGLRALRVEACQFRDADAEALASAAPLTGLTHLSLAANRLGDAGVWAILRSPYLQGLKRLSLDGNNDAGEDEELREELDRRFPGQGPLGQYDEEGWFAV